MEKKRSIEVMAISLFVAILGGWVLLTSAPAVFEALRYFTDTLNVAGFPWIVSIVFLSLVLPICFIVSGISCFLLKEWGRRLVFWSLLITLLIRIYGIITVRFFSSTMEGYTPVISQGDQIETQVRLISMIPNYIIMLFIAVGLYLITRPKVKEQFR